MKELKYIVIGLMFVLFTSLNATIVWPALAGTQNFKNEWKDLAGSPLNKDHRINVNWTGLVHNGIIFRGSTDTSAITPSPVGTIQYNVDVDTSHVASSVAGFWVNTDLYISVQKTDGTYVSNPSFTISNAANFSMSSMYVQTTGTRGVATGVAIGSVSYSVMRWYNEYIEANAGDVIAAASWDTKVAMNIDANTPDGQYVVCIRGRGNVDTTKNGLVPNLNDPTNSGYFMTNPTPTTTGFLATPPTNPPSGGQCRYLYVRTYFTVTNPGTVTFGSSSGAPVYVDESKPNTTYAATQIVNYTLIGAFDSTISVSIAGTTSGTISLTNNLSVRVGLGPIAGATTSNLGTTSLTNYSFPGNNYATTNNDMVIPVIYAIPNGQRPTNGRHTGSVTVTLTTN